MIKIKVILPKGINLDEECTCVTVPGVDGDFAVLEGHTPLITKIRSGVLVVEYNKQVDKFTIHDGFVSVDDDCVTIVTERIESVSGIDKNRAEEALKRAKTRLAQQNDPEIDYRRAEFALKRAITRIKAFSE